MGTVSNKGTITAIEGVLIETLDNGSIRLSTYDMTKGVRTTLSPISVEREGKFIVNAQRLYQTVRVLPDDELTIEVNEKLNCIIYLVVDVQKFVHRDSLSHFCTNLTEF